MRAAEYFAAHAIDPAVAAEVGVTEAGGALVYPYRDGAGAFERRRPLNGAEAKTLQPSGRPLVCWWPSGHPEPEATVLVCEGESDALAALSAISGAGNLHPAAGELLHELVVCAVPGASFPADRLVSELQGVGRVLLAPDDDEAGDRFAGRAADALRAAGIPCARLPLAGGDLADYLAAAEDRAGALAQVVADAEAEAPTPHAPAEPLPFVSAAELRANTPAEPDWIWQGYLAPGALTLLAAKPKAGKSTLAVAVSEAVASDAGSFLGRAVLGGPVIYVSEETAATLAHKLPAIDGIRILTRDACWPKPSWAELVAGSVAEARRIGAALLVVDTLPYWASLPAEAEKDAGAAQAAMQPLIDATRDGLAVLVPLHQRKGGGEDGEGVRGSGAIAGTADIVLELERVKRPCERVLLALSRYPSTPGSLLIERDPFGVWAAGAEGERSDARSIADRQSILTALDDGSELTRAELEVATGAVERQWHAQLDALIAEGKVQRTGAGRKGSPYRFALLRVDAAQAPAQHRAESPTSAASFSAALPVGEQQKEAGEAAATNGAHCAESLSVADAMPVEINGTLWTPSQLTTLREEFEVEAAEREAIAA